MDAAQGTEWVGKLVVQSLARRFACQTQVATDAHITVSVLMLDRKHLGRKKRLCVCWVNEACGKKKML